MAQKNETKIKKVLKKASKLAAGGNIYVRGKVYEFSASAWGKLSKTAKEMFSDVHENETEKGPENSGTLTTENGGTGGDE